VTRRRARTETRYESADLCVPCGIRPVWPSLFNWKVEGTWSSARRRRSREMALDVGGDNRVASLGRVLRMPPGWRGAYNAESTLTTRDVASNPVLPGALPNPTPGRTSPIPTSRGGSWRCVIASEERFLGRAASR